MTRYVLPNTYWFIFLTIVGSSCGTYMDTDKIISGGTATINLSTPIGASTTSLKNTRVTWAPRIDYLQYINTKYLWGTGASIQNNGFILKSSKYPFREFRTLNLTIPAYLYRVIGKRVLVFGGYGAGIPFSYTTYQINSKSRTEWFSSKIYPYTGSLSSGFIVFVYACLVRFEVNYIHSPFFDKKYALELNIPNDMYNLSFSLGVTIAF